MNTSKRSAILVFITEDGHAEKPVWFFSIRNDDHGYKHLLQRVRDMLDERPSPDLEESLITPHADAFPASKNGTCDVVSLSHVAGW